MSSGAATKGISQNVLTGSFRDIISTPVACWTHRDRELPYLPNVVTPELERLVAAPALAASRPGQHCAVRRQRGRQAAACGHPSTVGQRFLRLVLQMTRRSGAEHPVRHWLDEPGPYGSGATAAICACWHCGSATLRDWLASDRHTRP